MNRDSKNMKLSIITATYNSSQTIRDCMASVASQDYPELEHILVDGHSSDDTLAIIKEWEGQDHLRWVSEPDLGIYDALNKGVAMAEGDIVGFVHSDDMLSNPSIISEIVLRFKNEQVDGVYGDLLYVDKSNSDKVIRVWKSCGFQPKLLGQGWMPAHPTLFLKKEVYLKYGNFDLTYKIAADYDFMLRVLKNTELRFSYLPKVISKMRIGGASNRSISNILQKSREDFRAIKSNSLSYPIWVLLVKNLSKIPQFIKR